MAALSLISILGMIFTIVIKLRRNKALFDITLKALDLITIAVPPSLPGALVACLIYAQTRMKRNKIYCISPNSINLCGMIELFVFDKTGTLTEEDSDLKFVIPVDNSIHSTEDTVHYQWGIHEIRDHTQFEMEKHWRFIESMAACNSITYIDGKLAGDPLDLKVFEFTNWNLSESTSEETENFDMMMPTRVYPTSEFPTTKMTKKEVEISDIAAAKIGDVSDNPYEVGIVRQFPFSSHLQSMGVIIKSLNRPKFEFICKGSPEKIAHICSPSTLPNNFRQILDKYTRKGYRVIAIAYKCLEKMTYVKTQRIRRDKLENDLNFLGLIVLENRLKPETFSCISTLRSANIKPLMCTGDNILTALCVAVECYIVRETERVVVIEVNHSDSNLIAFKNANNFETISEFHSDSPGLEESYSEVIEFINITKFDSAPFLRRFFHQTN
jgi:magnesium-transporting ATPase (P-type)